MVETREDVEDMLSPVANDGHSAERGAALFGIHCVACHGSDGRGGGKVSEKMPPAPDLRHISICRRTDGFIYGTITAGGRAMPSLREGLSTRDRWDLVSFVRELQSAGCEGSAAGMGSATEPDGAGTDTGEADGTGPDTAGSEAGTVAPDAATTGDAQ
ncbi:MAG: cytochrome c [Deltaproteobacteria bacterium]|nr:cytochrome c [Deltaproteobacteria bacterium]